MKKKKKKIEEKIKKKKENQIEENIIRFNEVNDNNIKNDDNNIINEIIIDDGRILYKKRRKKKIIRKRNRIIKKEKGTDINKNNDNIMNINLNKNIITDGNNNNKESVNSPKIDEVKQLSTLMNYNDDEMNDLSYDLALKNDKRTYWQFYISLIKTKHEFIYAFFFNKDYNSKIIKMDLFFFGFTLNYTVNGLFFNDSTMHNVYESKGLFDIAYQFPIIVYSSFISMFLGALVQMLGLTSDAIIDFKQNEEKNNVKERGIKLIKKLKIKFVLYFMLSYILLLFFWYYISMFNAVYRNTQYLLLKDTAMGFLLSLISPFVIYLFPGIFRIPALAKPQKNRRRLYNFSKLFMIL